MRGVRIDRQTRAILAKVAAFEANVLVLQALARGAFLCPGVFTPTARLTGMMVTARVADSGLSGTAP